MKYGTSMPAPIVMKGDEDWYYLIGGNTRLMAARALGIRPKILLVDVSNKTITQEPLILRNEKKVAWICPRANQRFGAYIFHISKPREIVKISTQQDIDGLFETIKEIIAGIV